MRNVLPLVVTSLFVVALPSCRTATNGGARVASDGDDPWAKQAWMNKAAKTLLYGSSGLSPSEAEQLMPLSKEEIVENFTADPRFYDTALDFNLFFLGLKKEALRYSSDTDYRNEVFNERTAAAAAMELARGGDYFTLFNWKMPYALVGAPGIPNTVDGQNSIDTPEKRREYWLAKTKDGLDAWITAIQGSNDINALCARYVKNGGENDYTTYLGNAGIPDEINNAFGKGIKNEILCGAVGGQVSQSPTLKQDLLAEAKSYRDALPTIPTILGSLHTVITSPADLNIMLPATLPMLKEESLEAFSGNFWSNLANSSTNYNRKRAAYVLKTFFCDDLTPLNIVAPAQHAENKHASEPACQACHYKLDPMAGFFRNRGIFGANFDSLSLLIHDDQLRREGDDLTKYLASWKAPQGSSRIWDVGYIRSSKKENLNSYGESLGDLFKIIREAPESKTCLTKRMAEYVLGIGQVYDGRWLEALAQEFKDAAKPTAAPGDSSKAFKKVAKSLVLSRTFSTTDPVKGTCYDFAPNSEPSGLPCEVAFIIEKNCASCHSGDGSPKGLDVSIWKALPGGKSGFVHIDQASGQQLAPAVSLARIACSLSPTDQCPQAKLMPLNKDMDAVERATLYKWVQKELSGGGQ